MANMNLRNISNHFQDARLASLSSWRQASEIIPHDRGGPYVVLQEGYDPEDLTLTPDEFVLGRHGKWLSLAHFFRMPIPDRREEFVFGTAAEIMQVMRDLPSQARVMHPPTSGENVGTENDEMAQALLAGKSQSGR
jgi:hypothetical protein